MTNTTPLVRIEAAIRTIDVSRYMALTSTFAPRDPDYNPSSDTPAYMFKFECAGMSAMSGSLGTGPDEDDANTLRDDIFESGIVRAILADNGISRDEAAALDIDAADIISDACYAAARKYMEARA